MSYKDMTFCCNDNCNKRKSCNRAIENYSELKEKDVLSWTLFRCEEINKVQEKLKDNMDEAIEFAEKNTKRNTNGQAVWEDD